MKKENIYLDMSKLTEKQQKKVISLLPEAVSSYQYQIIKRDNCVFLLFDTTMKIWIVAGVNSKTTEITYKEFKKLMKKENKEKFVLPKKWCVKNKGHKDLIDYANEHGANPTYYLNDNAYFHFPSFDNCTTSESIKQGYTEITIKQFRKYVLKKKKPNLNKLTKNIEQWGEDRGFYSEEGATVQSQLIKLMEEVGEMSGNVARGKDVKDDIGDAFVVLTHIARLSNTTINECVNVAYNDIKDRKGKFIKGSFVKESDLSE